MIFGERDKELIKKKHTLPKVSIQLTLAAVKIS